MPNMAETKDVLGIPHYTYSEEFLEATRQLTNEIRNFERAMERIAGGQKTNRRSGTKRAGASPPGGTEGAESA